MSEFECVSEISEGENLSVSSGESLPQHQSLSSSRSPKFSPIRHVDLPSFEYFNDFKEFLKYSSFTAEDYNELLALYLLTPSIPFQQSDSILKHTLYQRLDDLQSSWVNAFHLTNLNPGELQPLHHFQSFLDVLMIIKVFSSSASLNSTTSSPSNSSTGAETNATSSTSSTALINENMERTTYEIEFECNLNRIRFIAVSISSSTAPSASLKQKDLPRPILFLKKYILVNDSLYIYDEQTPWDEILSFLGLPIFPVGLMLEFLNSMFTVFPIPIHWN